MHVWAEKLLAFQKKQIAVALREKQCAALPAEREQAAAGVRAAQAVRDAARAACEETSEAIRKTECELDGIRQRQRDFKAKSALIRNNDDYRAAMKQISQCEEEISSGEDRQLAEMERLESCQAAFREAESMLSAAEARAAAVLSELDEREASLRAAADADRQVLPALQEGIEPAFLREFLRLRASSLIPATTPVLVPLSGTTCGGCHMTVPSQLQATARTGRTVTCCPLCHVMLYWDD